jgi:cell shape-determining protein MreC
MGIYFDMSVVMEIYVFRIINVKHHHSMVLFLCSYAMIEHVLDLRPTSACYTYISR